MNDTLHFEYFVLLSNFIRQYVLFVLYVLFIISLSKHILLIICLMRD